MISIIRKSQHSFQPDFSKIAEANGWQAMRCDKPQEMDKAIRHMVESPEPYLLDCRMTREENCFPDDPGRQSA